MRICMFTNTYLPHIGGVARSVATFAQDLRHRGHRVLIIAPTFEPDQGRADHDPEILRVPAIQNFNGSDFSLRLPLPFTTKKTIELFAPQIIHSHHPFLLGDTALRTARQQELPLVFTHHTLYERYTHYVPMESEAMKRFIIRLSTHYANMCSRIIAPSASIERILRQRGVKRPIVEIPTGVDIELFNKTDRGASFRQQFGISDKCFLIGHCGRLAREKNLEFLPQAIAETLETVPRTAFLVIGRGPFKSRLESFFASRGLSQRLIMPGSLTGSELAAAYQAMDIFAFASTSETQGLVLAEAMAASTPVVALEASGTREVVEDMANGRLLSQTASYREFSAVLCSAAQDRSLLDSWTAAARKTAGLFSRKLSTDKLVSLYTSLIAQQDSSPFDSDELLSWESLLRGIKTEWKLLSKKTAAAVTALVPDDGRSWPQ
ncbi:glycosyl transferase family 1 [candidate division MSBL1 archaeon SCGC-AAA385M11]|nr:glycosyl transferase family 1 [candidate division MSBL1 archaeon SCGC-AAA385M11]